MHKNNDLAELVQLLNNGDIREVTLLSQKLKKNTACGKIIQGYHPDEVLAKLEKYIKQYDLYAYLLDEQQHIVF